MQKRVFQHFLKKDDLFGKINNMVNIKDILSNYKNIALVGASKDLNKTSTIVMKYLQNYGYKVYPVNPTIIGQVILGERVYGKVSEIKAGKKPYKLQLVGLELGGKPIEDYAPDFWLISNANGGDPVGFITSPWWHPEKKTNIAMGYVPFDGTLNANGFPKGKVGTKFKVHLPEKYSNSPGQPVDAVIVDIPFKESFNANTREVVSG